MTDETSLSPALLPPGFVDLLPPEALAEAEGTETLMSVFAGHGYERVSPPLLEFEESLLSGSGAAVAEQAFRLMDPDTRRMMALRPDITPQIARIAATRLHDAPRPLRLCYAGQCVIIGNGTASQSGRQVGQAGIELIGPDSPAADAEIVALAAEALERFGVQRVSFDLTMPLLAPAVMEAAGLTAEARAGLVHALDRKDAAEVTRLGGDCAEVLTTLLHAAGPAERALAALAAAPLPPAARVLSDRLAASVAAILARAPGLRLTIDPVEFRGWRYHTGVCVTVYAAGHRDELGRGGRYLCNNNEPACGLTLRPEALLRAKTGTAGRMRVFVPAEIDVAFAARLRAEGYATVAGLEPVNSVEDEARRLGCSHLASADSVIPLD